MNHLLPGPLKSIFRNLIPAVIGTKPLRVKKEALFMIYQNQLMDLLNLSPEREDNL